jgi:hypothetical protein
LRLGFLLGGKKYTKGYAMKKFAALLGSLFITSSLSAGSPPLPVATVVNEVRVPVVLDNPAGVIVIAPDGTNAQVILDASASTDPDNDPLQFEWGVSDEGSLHVFATSVRATNTFRVGGYTLGLVVSDGTTRVTERFTLSVYPPEVIALFLIDILDDDALPGKPKRSLRAPLEQAFKNFEQGDERHALQNLRVFLQKAKVQPVSTDPAVALGVQQLAQILIDTVSGR